MQVYDPDHPDGRLKIASAFDDDVDDGLPPTLFALKNRRLTLPLIRDA